jgi:hypothetical protein
VHAQRDPIDTCLSCFFQNFSKGQEYSFDLKNLGHFYNGYSSLMQHWQNLFGDKILNVQYEDLIASPESKIRQIIEYCELDWEPACLSPQDTVRPVATASKYQVRQAINSSSVGKWQHYEKHLKPLLDTLKLD